MGGETYDRFNSRCVGYQLLDFGFGALDGFFGDVSHKNIGALFGEEDTGL